MRTPRIAASGFLSGFLAGALVCILGGPGGAWIALRNERRRIDAHDDDLEQLRQRIARREGAAGRAVALSNRSQEAEEIDRIVASSRNGKRPHANSTGEPDIDPMVRATVEGWLHQGRRE